MRFYATKAWKQIRLERLSKDNYLCQRCKKKGLITAGTTVHHVKPLEDYPELALDINNLTSLCNTCHEQIEKRRQRWREKKKGKKKQRKARVIVSKANKVKV